MDDAQRFAAAAERGTLVAPFPWFGGKRRAAPIVWPRLGDPSGYVEPFAGSAAMLLARPDFDGRRVETLNDADGWLVNTWRAIQLRPAEVAGHCVGPVTEIDYHARLAWLQARRDGLVSWLEGDPEVCDPKAAAWWLYVVACGIGNPFAPGPWHVTDGHLRNGDAGRGIQRQLPHLGSAGQGIQTYMELLSRRLLRVRITCGDWGRVVTPAVARAGASGDGSRAVFLDPPYDVGGRSYHEAQDVGFSAQVRAWCTSPAAAGLRIALCGYEAEHDDLLAYGWTVVIGKSGSGSGYSSDPAAGLRERVWFSPSCVAEQAPLLW